MVITSSASKESGSRHTTYCRKQKSLGLLCSNFLSLYNQDGVETIGLDDAAARLGVERRRIYDIVNVLESVGVLSRKAKNRYSWKGIGAIPRTLQELKQEGLRENYHSFYGNICVQVSEDEQLTNSNTFQNVKLNSSSGSSKTDNRKEKSLGLLTQNFIKLFLCSNMDMISLDEAAKILLGDAQEHSVMRTKVRRLYDIANVLSSLNFIEKIHHPETRKHAFRWLGMREKSQSGSYIALVVNETKKRTFGTDHRKTSFKRSKVVSPIDVNTDQLMETEKQVKCETFENEVDKSNLEQGSRQDVKNYQFGPSAPVNISKVGSSENNKVKQVREWENLTTSTHHSQYHNQALRDLFAHFVEAWKSWYFEVVGKNPIQLLS